MQVNDGYMHVLIGDHQASGNYMYLTLDAYLTINQHYKCLLFETEAYSPAQCCCCHIIVWWTIQAPQKGS
jgi:hypothetical protein